MGCDMTNYEEEYDIWTCVYKSPTMKLVYVCQTPQIWIAISGTLMQITTWMKCKEVGALFKDKKLQQMGTSLELERV